MESLIEPGFSVIHANYLEDLREIAVSWIGRYPLNPLEKECFLVQSHGMGQWLKLAVASDSGCGICAAMDIVLPGRFIWNAYRALLGEDAVPINSPFDQERLVWRIMKLLPSVFSEASDTTSSHFEPVRRFFESEDLRKPYQLSCRIASLFDQYQVYRADWLDAWAEGEDILINSKVEKEKIGEDLLWQPELWRRIKSGMDESSSTASRSDLHRRFLEAAANFNERPERFPRRVAVFGISSLPGAVIEALDAISRFTQVLLFVQNPCRHYWADIRESRRYGPALVGHEKKETLSISYPENSGSEATNNEKIPFFDYRVNPLLAAWGKQGRDYIGMLTDLEQRLDNFNQTELFRDVVTGRESATLLEQIQQAILDLTPVSGSSELMDGDDSVTFHLCHTPQRELEVLQDRLLNFFETMPGLSPKDIVVMTPDIDSYAPYISAVFGSISPEDPRYIPFTIADKPEEESRSLVAGLEKLLSIPDSRMNVSDVMELLHIPALRRRFGLSESDIPDLVNWIQGAGIRWGLSTEQRAGFSQFTGSGQGAIQGHGTGQQVSQVKKKFQKEYRENGIGEKDRQSSTSEPGSAIWEQNSWRFGIQRMMLGYSSGRGDSWMGIEPYDEVGGLEASLAGILFSIVEKLEKHWRSLSEPALPDEWGRRIRELLKDFFLPSESSERFWLMRMEEVIESWLDDCREAELDEPLIIAVVRDHILKSVQDSAVSRRFLSGMVNFCTLMPMRAIPFRVVCLLGMNDGAYPRSQPPLDFDLMALPGLYRPGDRSRREDDRYLFLEALLSAREKLHIGYTGRSIRDNSERVPSVLVAQLRDYIEAGWSIKSKDAAMAQAGAEVVDAEMEGADAEKGVPAKKSALDLITIQHPLQPFSRSYFRECAQKKLFTYAREWRDVLSGPEKRGSRISGRAFSGPFSGSGSESDSGSGGGSASKKAYVDTADIRDTEMAGIRKVELSEHQFDGSLSFNSLAASMRNPVKSLFNNRLKIYFDDVDPASEDQEPFEPGRMAPFEIGNPILRSILAAPAEKRGAEQKKKADDLLKTGMMPVNAFGEIAVSDISDMVSSMLRFHDMLLVEWPSDAGSIEIQHGCSVKDAYPALLEDSLVGLRTNGDLSSSKEMRARIESGQKGDSFLREKNLLCARWDFYPGKVGDSRSIFSRYDALIPTWVRHIAGAAAGIRQTSYLVATDMVVTLSPVEPPDAEKLLDDLMKFWCQAMHSTLPVTAKSAFAYLKGFDSLPGPQDEGYADIEQQIKAVEAAKRTYEGDGYNSAGEVGYNRYLRRVFPDFNSMWRADNNRFHRLAINLYLPVMEHAEQYL